MKMADDEAIHRLKARLHWESGDPLARLTNQAVRASAAITEHLAGWVRERGEERPLVSLLFAFPSGFTAGRWRPRRAKH